MRGPFIHVLAFFLPVIAVAMLELYVPWLPSLAPWMAGVLVLFIVANKERRMRLMTIKLGQKAKDKVTGFEGIIVGRIEYLFGCNQYGIAPEAKDGKVNESHWFDEGRIEITGPGILPEEVTAEKPGGPNRDCPR